MAHPTSSRIKRARRQRDRMAVMPYGALITSVNPSAEEVIYLGPRGGSRTPISHPYLGPNSWVRIIPERGTKAILGTRAENGEPYLSSYVSQFSSDRLLQATDDNRFYYRRLQEGEIELCSPGIAEVFLGRSGNLELRGGSVSIELSNSNLEIASRSPTHSRSILGNKRKHVGDEERFGVVSRPNESDSTRRNYIRLADDETFAKEYLRIIKSGTSTLIDHREGHVYDDSGDRVKSGKTGNFLRSSTNVLGQPDEFLKLEVDDSANVFISVPESADQGLYIEVLGSNFDVRTKNDFVVDSERNIKFRTDNVGLGISSSSITLGTDSGNFSSTGALIRGGSLNQSWRALLPLLSAIVAGSPPQNAIAVQTLQQVLIQMVNALQPSLSTNVSTT